MQPCGCLYDGNLRFLSGALALYGGIGLPLLPDQPGGPPLVVSAIDLVKHRGWINERQIPGLSLPDRLTFLDIGAGVPEHIDPPDDWTMD